MLVEIRYSEREYLEAVQVARTRAAVLLRDTPTRYRGFIPGILKTIAVLALLAALVLAGRADPMRSAAQAPLGRG
jgi:hypothetical protein